MLFRELARRLLAAKPKIPQKLPEFLIKKPTIGKITGNLDEVLPEEKRFYEELRDLGNNVEVIQRGPGRTPDIRINGVPHERKTVRRVQNTEPSRLSGSISSRILDARGQASNIIIDARSQQGMNKNVAEEAIRRAYGADSRNGIDSITILTPDGPVFAPRRP
ncbi:MAG: hypothetical protein WC807_13800 [Hyphomicrobium sp.]